MSSDVLLFNFSQDEILNSLKVYQRDISIKLIEDHGLDKAAEIWIDNNNLNDLKKFGGIQEDKKKLYDFILDEFNLFICGDKKYKSDRQKLASASSPTALLFVSSISSIISAYLGLAAALITPVIAILLCSISKIGVNAWCKFKEK